LEEELREETNKSLKAKEENTIKQVKEFNKNIQELKMEIEAIKKTQKEATLKMDNLGKKSRAIDEIITNRIQEIEENLKFRRYHRKYRHIPQRKYKV
jgi:predicted  nucleic acid-binding Zn-ribbon protein